MKNKLRIQQKLPQDRKKDATELTKKKIKISELFQLEILIHHYLFQSAMLNEIFTDIKFILTQ